MEIFLLIMLVRFENLRSDMNYVFKTLGIEDTTLPWLIPGDKSDYRRYYDTELRDIVTERYAQEISFFGYGFDD